MTVKELIRELEKFDEKLPVEIPFDERTLSEVERVENRGGIVELGFTIEETSE